MKAKPSKIMAAGLVCIATLGACSSSDPNAAVRDAITASVTAENAKDADAFLALWTDRGLEEYDVGTRADLEAGQVESFGADRINVVSIDDVVVDGEQASATVLATVGEDSFAQAVFKVSFSLIDQEGTWLLDGFEFQGGPTIQDGVEVLDVGAQDYAFMLSESEVAGDIAMRFHNDGTEPHEIAFFSAPAGTDAATAKEDLSGVDGGSLDDLPEGYESTHLAFAEPGGAQDVVLARPLAPGTYVFACFIPTGGFGDQGPLDPNGVPHIELGMVQVLTVA